MRRFLQPTTRGCSRVGTGSPHHRHVAAASPTRGSAHHGARRARLCARRTPYVRGACAPHVHTPPAHTPPRLARQRASEKMQASARGLRPRIDPQPTCTAVGRQRTRAAGRLPRESTGRRARDQRAEAGADSARGERQQREAANRRPAGGARLARADHVHHGRTAARWSSRACAVSVPTLRGARPE